MRTEAHVNEFRAAISQVLNAYNLLRGLIEEQDAKGYLTDFNADPAKMGANNSDITGAEFSGARTAIVAVLGTQMTNAQRTALYKVKV